jgi:hypothetical protein
MRSEAVDRFNVRRVVLQPVVQSSWWALVAQTGLQLHSQQCAAAAAVMLCAANLAPQWSLLLPHQREGVLAGLRRGGRLLLADEMGLGKTAQVRCAGRRRDTVVILWYCSTSQSALLLARSELFAPLSSCKFQRSKCRWMR